MNISHPAVAEIDSIRTILGIRNIIHKPCHDAVATFYFTLSTFYFTLSTFYFTLSTFYFTLSTFHFHRELQTMDKLMNRNLVKQTEVRVVVARNVSSLHIVRGEMTEEVALQFPLGISLFLGWNIAEVRSHATTESQGLVLAVHHA